MLAGYSGALRGKAVSEVEIFAPTGVLTGITARVPLTNDGPDLAQPLTVDEARWYPLDGSPPVHRGLASTVPDDILLIVTDEPELKVHMAWYSVELEIGPYRVAGQLATHPGFDPDRAIARPGSAFIAISDATIELLGRDDIAPVARPYLHVNRYAVERAASTLMLAHFFPGAHLVARETVAAS
jgi:hypothetical protein